MQYQGYAPQPQYVDGQWMGGFYGGDRPPRLPHDMVNNLTIEAMTMRTFITLQQQTITEMQQVIDQQQERIYGLENQDGYLEVRINDLLTRHNRLRDAFRDTLDDD